MSRTHKDKPWWVQAVWYKPDHDMGCPHRIPRYGTWPPVACNLPPEPSVTIFAVAWRRKAKHGCHWAADYRSAVGDHRYIYTRGPRRKERHFDWWGPSRANVRDVLSDAGKCYRGDGDAGDREPRGHHRHHTFGGDYWD